MLAQNATTNVSGMHIHDDAKVAVFGTLQNEADTLYNDGHLTMIGDSLINMSVLAGEGVLQMSGDYAQYITHEGEIKVDTLILDNVLNVNYDNIITVDKHISFVNGILRDLYDATYLPEDLPYVMMTANAGYDTLQVRDESHIDGLVKKQGATRFVFPIGDDYMFRPVVADGISKDTLIAARYYYEFLDYPASEIEVGLELYRDEYWYVEGAEKHYDLSLTYDPRTSDLDPTSEYVKVISFDGERDESYRLIDPELQSVLGEISLMARPDDMDSSFVWYGFADRTFSLDNLFIPQVLTPNNDGFNDRFVIDGLEYYEDNKLLIFNRYGDVLYEMSDYDNSWDGRPNRNVIGNTSDILPSGTYFVFFYTKNEVVYKDFVQILHDK